MSDKSVFKPVTGFPEREVDDICLLRSGWHREEYKRADTGHRNFAGTATHVRFWKGSWEVDLRAGWLFKPDGITPDKPAWRAMLVRCPKEDVNIEDYVKTYSIKMRPLDAFKKFVRTLHNAEIMPQNIINMKIT